MLSVKLDGTLAVVVGTVLVWVVPSVLPVVLVQQVIRPMMRQMTTEGGSADSNDLPGWLLPLQDTLSLSAYWSSEDAYFDASFSTAEILVCLTSAS